MNARAGSVKRPAGDHVFIAIAIAVTSLWVIVGLFPSVWVALTAFKTRP